MRPIEKEVFALTIDLLLLIAMTIAAVWSVLKKDLVKAAIALAGTSIILTILMFRLASPLAAVFELSVCAGLITVILMSTISLTKPPEGRQKEEQSEGRVQRFALLPLLAVAAAVLTFAVLPFNFALPQAVASGDVRTVLWDQRQLDLLGQIAAIIAGVFGVSLLFKEKLKSAGRTGASWRRAGVSSTMAAGDDPSSDGGASSRARALKEDTGSEGSNEGVGLQPGGSGVRNNAGSSPSGETIRSSR
jgi:NADH-quinone oxidoreductase subunit J